MSEKDLTPFGSYIDYKPPQKTQIVIRVKKDALPSPPPITNVTPVQYGNYSVARADAKGNIYFQPLVNSDAYLANGGRIHLGASYYESSCGYLVELRNGGLIEFTNFKGKIESKDILLSVTGESAERYTVSLFTDDGKFYRIFVPAENWNNLLEYIEKQAPLCQVYGDVISNYKERFKRLSNFWLKKDFPTRLIASFWGWGPQGANKGRKFYHRGCPDCTSSKELYPQTHPSQNSQLIRECMGHIMAAGPLNVTVPLLMYSLASYTDAIFSDAGFPLTHCLMLIGESGYFKSTFSREIFSPFVPYEERLHTVRSTEASLNVLHEIAYDDTLVIDDFNLEGNPSEVRMKMRNIRGLVRGYSDKSPRAKYGGNNNVKKYAMRGGCVFTAETPMTGQLKSGDLRLLKVFLHAPLDASHISILHGNPHLVLASYSAYIRYLEANYIQLVDWVKNQLPIRRNITDVQEPRMRDAVIHLTMVAEILHKFLVDSSVCDMHDSQQWFANASSVLHQLGVQQSRDARSKEPYLRYLAEVWNLIGVGKIRIAKDFSTYISSISSFDGYRENDLFIVKKDDVYKAVIEAFYARNEGLPISIDEVSKKLKENGLTKCDKGSCLIKASSRIPGRPRMIAFRIHECQEKLKREGF